MASHGITRTPYSKETRSEALRQEELQKISEYNAVVKKVLETRKASDYSPAALQLTSDLLKRNPEYYTIWNYRKEILERGIFPSILKKGTCEPRKDGGDDDEAIMNNNNELLKVIKSELMHLIPLMKTHPKCYSLWNHRLWTLRQSSKHLPQGISLRLWQEELGLVGMMLGRDERNFHGWMYRRFVVGAIEGRDNAAIVSGSSKELEVGGNGKDGKRRSLVKSEFEYTTNMIKANMSNYSAWHNRSKLIPRLLDERGASRQDRMDFLEDEISFLRAALLTKPQDQSLWFYHGWLIRTNASPAPPNGAITPNMAHPIKIALVKSEIEELLGLLHVHPDHRKWILVALVNLTGLLRKLRICKPEKGEIVDEEEVDEEEEEEEEEQIDGEVEMKRVKEWVRELIEIDGGVNGKGRRWADLEKNIGSRIGW